MNTIAQIFVVLAGVFHLAVFAMESLLFLKPSTYQRFGVRNEAEAMIAKPWAYNQGFYNLFLAIITIVGLALLGSQEDVGRALSLAGTGSMLGAALVLVTHDRSMARAAITQGTLPALAVLFLLLSM